MPGARITIVEDQELISGQLKKYLELNDFEVIAICRNGDEAIISINENTPDLILMDIELNGTLDGIETTKVIKNNHDLPIVYLTASIDNKTLDRAKQTEPAGFVTKNITQREIKIQIEFALYKHKMLLERKRIQDMLDESRERFKSIFNSAPDAIFFISFDCQVLFWNPAAEKIFGITESEAYERPLYDLIISRDDREEFKKSFNIWKYTRNENQFKKTFELMAKKPDDSIFPVEMTLSLLAKKEERAVCGFARDVRMKYEAEDEISKLIEEMQISKEIIEQNASELVVLNSKLSESEEKLKELNASKDRFFSIIAHDLKGPFQSLLGYSEILSADVHNLSKDEISEFASSLHQSASHLFKLLENLLQWSRLQRGVIEHNPENAPLALLVNQNIELVQIRAAEKQIELTNNVSDDIFVFADVNMLNTILRNLITNSIKFTKPGGDIGVDAEIKHDIVEIRVWDTGIGMDEEAMKKIFRIDKHHTTIGTNNEHGTGLGLILCKELTEKNNGQILVESVVGEGTTFVISLPRGNPDAMYY